MIEIGRDVDQYDYTRRYRNRHDPVMKTVQLDRLSIRTLLAIGSCVTFGLWLYTGYAFTQRIETVQRNATELTARYTEDIDRPIAARGLGLVIVRERANRLGGTIPILSAPGEGTRIMVSLPQRRALA